MFKSARLLNQKGLAPLFILIAIAVVGIVGGGYYYQTQYKPALIKETTVKIHTDYKALSNSTSDLLEKLNDESSGSDPESFQRTADRLNKAAGEVDKNVTSLSQSLAKKQSETSEFTVTVEDYLSKSKELSTFAKGGANLVSKIADSTKQLAEISKDMMELADPKEAKSKIKEGIEQLDEVIKDVEQVHVEKEYAKSKNAYVDLLKASKDYFSAIGEALETSDRTIMVNATSVYNTKTTDQNKKMTDSAKDIKDKTESLESELKKAQEAVDSKYDTLDSKYK